MPVVGIPLETLYRLVGKKVDREELYDHLTGLGCDVEGYFEVTRFKCATCGEMYELTPEEALPGECSSCTTEFVPDQTLLDLGKSEVVRMELVPARPDMFDVGGLSRAMRGYLGLEAGIPRYDLSPSGMTVQVMKAVKAIRPCIACACVRGLELDTEAIKTIMKMQENLHWAIGRDRRKASIGVYDLGSLEPDFKYTAYGKGDLEFVPLGGMPNQGLKPVTLEKILELHPKGKAYKHLLEEFDSYPILEDSTGRVLSMPPIINSEETKADIESRDLFVDVTGHERRSVDKALNVLVCSLAELGGRIETVRILDGREEIHTPDLEPEESTLNPEHASHLIGVEISADSCVELLKKMRFDANIKGDKIQVLTPPFRTDIMHEYDLIEDIAIAYGYNNLERALVPTMTVGTESTLERGSTRIRKAMIGMRFHEVVTTLLSNPDSNYTLLRKEDDGIAATIENPATVEYTIIRTHLISGLLEVFRRNRTHKMPQRIFELGDTVVLDREKETGTADRRGIAAAIMDPKTGFAEIKSCAQALLSEEGRNLELRAADDPTFMPGRCAAAYVDGIQIGTLGEVHPEVLENFQIVQPVSLLHLSTEQFFTPNPSSRVRP